MQPSGHSKKAFFTAVASVVAALGITAASVVSAAQIVVPEQPARHSELNREKANQGAFNSAHSAHSANTASDLKNSIGSIVSTPSIALGGVTLAKNSSVPDLPTAAQGAAKPSVVYRQNLADGRVLYTDTPVSGQKVAKIIEVDLRSTQTWSALVDMQKPVATALLVAPPGAPVDATKPTEPTPVRLSAVDRLDNASRGLAAAQSRLTVAENRFTEITVRAKTSEVPLAGERSVNVNGSSRLNESYFSRQAQHTQALRSASVELDAALSMVRAAEGR